MPISAGNLVIGKEMTWYVLCSSSLKRTSGSKSGNIWSKTATESSDPDPDPKSDPEPELLARLAAEHDVGDEDPNISSNPTRLPQTPADIST